MPCLCCNRIRGYVYTGPAYSEKFHYLSGCICPWCVADGSAAKRFPARFADTGTVDGISTEIREELETKTPGFEAWQQEQWMVCCKDAAAYLGRAGASELKNEFAAAIPALKRWVKDEPTAYIFRCLHCQNYLAYADDA
ncbi:MAG: CbrC family protein [Acidobacteria bacterium]|nr:CbrC family protein [Acidobacteriota bacterium]